MISLVAVVALLLIGGYWLASTGAWRRYAPTSMLLALENDAYGANFKELIRRYQSGKLNTPQIQRLFDQNLQPHANFKAIDPHPAYVPIRVKFDIEFNSIGLARRLTPNSPPQVWADQERIDARAAPLTNSSLENDYQPLPVQKWGEVAILPGLPPGQHEISFVQDMIYLPGAPPTAPALTPWTLRVSQTITVVDDPASAFVKLRTDNEGGYIHGEILLTPNPRSRNFRGPSGREIPLRFRGVTAPIVGVLELRLDSEQEFRQIKRVVHDGATDYRDLVYLSALAGISNVRQADARIVPGPPELAIEYGLREYYGRVIEWPGVLLEIDSPVKDADEGLAQVIEFLNRFGGQYGTVYRNGNIMLRFEGKVAVFPDELRRGLRRHFPQFEFCVARMTYSLGRHRGPINLLVVSDADSGEVRTHALAIWMSTPAGDFFETFAGVSCDDAQDVNQKARALASLVAFVMDGEVGSSKLSQSDRAVDVELFRPQWSMSKPSQKLCVSFDEEFVVLRVEILRCQVRPAPERRGRVGG